MTFRSDNGFVGWYWRGRLLGVLMARADWQRRVEEQVLPAVVGAFGTAMMALVSEVSGTTAIDAARQHDALDALMARYLRANGFGATTVLQLQQWSFQQLQLLVARDESEAS